MAASSVREKFHTAIFLFFGLGILLTYGLGTASFSFPKWLLLILAAAFVAVWWTLRLSAGRKLSFDQVDLILAAICLYGGLSVLWSPDPGGGFAQWVCLLAMVILLQYARNGAEQLAFRVSLVCVCAVSIMLLRGFLNADVSGGFGNENYFAETLLLCLPFCLLWTATNRTSGRWIGIILCAASLYLLIGHNNSRIEYLALPALFWAAGLVWLTRKAGWQAGLGWILAPLISLVVAVYVFRDSLLAFDPVLERVELYLNTIALWWDRPLFGWGLGGFDFIYPRYQQNHLTLFPSLDHTALGSPFALADAAHNEALHILAETGIPGLLLAGIVILLAVAKGADWDRQSPTGIAAACSLVFLCVIGALNFPLRNPATAAVAMVILGILLKREKDTSPVFTLQISPALAIAGKVGQVGAFAIVLAAMGNIYLSGLEFALSQVLRERSPQSAFSRILSAHERFPMSPQFRRQQYLTYVNWVSVAPDRKVPLSRDHVRYYEIAKSAGVDNPGILISRITFLLLAGLNRESVREIENHLVTLKRQTPKIAEVHIVEGLFAREIGDSRRAARAVSVAEELINWRR